jgi:hypothetical protein
VAGPRDRPRSPKTYRVAGADAGTTRHVGFVADPELGVQQGSSAVSRVNVAVAVSDDARSWINEVAAACRALGLCHTATLAGVGVLTGSVELDDVGKLWAVTGVVAVEVEAGFASPAAGHTLQ